MRFSKTIISAAALLVMGFTGTAEASLISYSFTVTATSGPLNGTVANGTFGYDSSSITPGLTNAATGLLTTLNFTWHGIAYTEATANTGALVFDPSGTLLLMLFGSNCGVNTCPIPPGQEWWNIAGANGFNYSTPTAGAGIGTVVLTQTTGTPEPSSWVLGLLGLAAIALARRKTTGA